MFTSSQFDFSTHFEDYSVFHAPAKKLSRRGRKSGGVAVLVRKSLMQFLTCVECDYDNMICFKLSKDRLGIDRDLLFVSLYVPPYQSPYYKQCDTNCSIHHLEDFLLSLCENGGTSYIMVAGDRNARIGDWSLSADVTSNDVFRCDVDEEGNRQSQDKITNQFGKNIDRLLYNISLHSFKRKSHW